MSFFNRRASLLAALAASLMATNPGIAAAMGHLDDFIRAPRPSGGRRPRPRKITLGRFCNHRGAAGYAKLSPPVDGVRMRWQDGVLVPRATPQPARVTTPIREARRARRDAAKLARKARR